MADQIIQIDSILQFNKLLKLETQHPLIAIVDFEKINTTIEETLFSTGFYSILLKDACQGTLRYGRNRYDYDEQTMIFVAPRQVIGVEGNQNNESGKGLGLFFHTDLLKGTSLASNIKTYNFFSYEVNEALHLSAEERRTIGDCMAKISNEVTRPIDKHSKRIIVSNIELLLDYCQRYYDRQFITREVLNHDILSRFESLISNYFESGVAEQKGLPSVKYCAEKLALSPSYMSDVIKRETGKSAVEHIQLSTIDRAKIGLQIPNSSISQIAHSLGFEYPQYFSRLFKKHTGQTPNEYRSTIYS